ncbi:hypothetical protein ARZXY2_2532 [Arthrobacter sp. ZXY-2]|nr:hypothetical protein ARZXY2_2532 [Arthrobacter sp. ZXY-2]
MSGIKLPAITRPNSSVYRPRKITTETWGNEDEITDIVVFGTHDVEFARTVALRAADEVSAEYYSSGWHLDVAETGDRVWRTRCLAAWDEGRPIYQWWDDPDKGRAGVRFSVTEDDDPDCYPEPDPNQMELPL